MLICKLICFTGFHVSTDSKRKKHPSMCWMWNKTSSEIDCSHFTGQLAVPSWTPPRPCWDLLLSFYRANSVAMNLLLHLIPQSSPSKWSLGFLFMLQEITQAFTKFILVQKIVALHRKWTSDACLHVTREGLKFFFFNSIFVKDFVNISKVCKTFTNQTFIRYIFISSNRTRD